MIRPRRRKAKEHIVEIGLTIFEEKVQPRFNCKKLLLKHSIHKQEHNRYFQLFLRIAEYLEELRGDYVNELEDMIEDYLTNIFKYYERFGRTPSLNQFSPSAANQIRFEEWTCEYSRENDEQYLQTELTPEIDITMVNTILPETELAFIEV